MIQDFAYFEHDTIPSAMLCLLLCSLAFVAIGSSLSVLYSARQCVSCAGMQSIIISTVKPYLPGFGNHFAVYNIDVVVTTGRTEPVSVITNIKANNGIT